MYRWTAASFLQLLCLSNILFHSILPPLPVPVALSFSFTAYACWITWLTGSGLALGSSCLAHTVSNRWTCVFECGARDCVRRSNWRRQTLLLLLPVPVSALLDASSAIHLSINLSIHPAIHPLLSIVHSVHVHVYICVANSTKSLFLILPHLLTLPCFFLPL